MEFETVCGFQNITHKNFTIYFKEETQKYVQKTITDIDDNVDKMCRDLGFSFKKDMLIYIVDNGLDFERASGLYSEDLTHIVGVAQHGIDSVKIVIATYGQDFTETLLHEISHSIIDYMVLANIPMWFKEGMAMWHSGERVCGLIPSLTNNELYSTERPEDIQDVLNVCKSGFSLVEYLIRKEGICSVSDLMDCLVFGNGFACSFKMAFGESMESQLNNCILDSKMNFNDSIWFDEKDIVSISINLRVENNEGIAI